MFLTSLNRILKHGLANFWRNKAISSALISVLTLMLVIITGVAVLLIIAQTLLQGIEAKVDISATFKPEAAETDVLNIKKSLEGLDEVKSAEYVSEDEALEQFKERHKNDEVVQKSLEELGTNPFGATLNIKAKLAADSTQFERIARFLQQDIYSDLVDKINYFDNKAIIERLSQITAATRRAGVILSLVLIFIALLVAFNTFRLAIYTERERITIMRLVGSSNWFIRGPIIVESVMNGLAAAAITSLVFMIGLNIISPRLSVFFSGPDFNLNIYQTYAANFWQFFLMQAVIAIALAIISSLIAMRRYLKV